MSRRSRSGSGGWEDQEKVLYGDTPELRPISSKTCLLHFPFFLVILHYLLFVSAASDVDPGNVAGLGTTEPAVADKDAADQTGREQPVDQPAVEPVAETAEEDPAKDKAGARTPTRGEETVGTPPPSSVAEEGDKVPTPPPTEEERAPTPILAEASTLEGSPSRGKGPMITVTLVGGSEEGAEAPAASNEEVEEI